MKHKWTNNLGLKIVSLLVSCLIWVVVTNTNDPESIQVYKNVPITIKNQDTITNANKTFTVVDGVDKINVYVTARKSVRSSLTAGSFTVKADMENYNEALGTVPLEISCEDGRIRQEDIRMIPSSLKISMEDKVEQNFGVAVVTTGIAPRISAACNASLLAPPRCPDNREITNFPHSSITSTAGSFFLLCT